MKLLELLVKERWEWYTECAVVAQDSSTDVVGYDNRDLKFENNMWYPVKHAVSIMVSQGDTVLADDHATAIVTRGAYEQACKWVDDGYTLWFGGVCPVEQGTLVDIKFAWGESIGTDLDHLIWSSDISNPILAYRIIGATTFKQPVLVQGGACTAPSILEKGAQHMRDRASQRDTPDGERSMARTVKAFNALFGYDLTETEGWRFMELLKISRSVNGFNVDDYEDGAAYAALAGEAHSNA